MRPIKLARKEIILMLRTLFPINPYPYKENCYILTDWLWDEHFSHKRKFLFFLQKLGLVSKQTDKKDPWWKERGYGFTLTPKGRDLFGIFTHKIKTKDVQE